MGEVYRARDPKLNRDVALKVLPDAFTHDPERVARFRREAQVLAALNHPHIAQIYGLEEANGSKQCLVLELVDGESLGTRLLRGPIPVDDALSIAEQIADALEAAHERGIIHRDLKPANVAVSKDGTVKVLDFGLAKAVEPAVIGDLTNSPTLASPAMMTGVGVILGTAAYMSPEQARGRPIDRRADVWAFGCIVYEMLSGRRAFPQGETVSDTIAKVLEREPDWQALPPMTSPKLRSLLERCLRKDARRRLHDMADARIEIEDIRNEPFASAVSAAMPQATQPSRRATTLIAIVGVLLLTTATLALRPLFKSPPSTSPSVKFEVFPPEGATLLSSTAGTLSPDGRKLAFVATTRNLRQIWVRPLDSLTAQLLPGSDNAAGIFWSPDSQYIGFFAQNQLKKVAATGGPPQVLCNLDLPASGGLGAWSAEGVILVGPGPGFGGTATPLFRVSAGGGEATPATELDASRQELGHSFPSFLPDGRHYLFLVLSPQGAAAYVGTLNSKERHLLPGIASGVRYSPTGYVLFLRGSSLMAQRFDASRLALSGDVFPLADLGAGSPQLTEPYSVSTNGTLLYRASPGGAAPTSQLGWFDRTGKQLASVGPSGTYGTLQLSPDGRYVAFERGNPPHIWVLDTQTGVTSRLTNHPAADAWPVWSPDGRAIVFGSSRAGPLNLYERPFGVVGEDRLLLKTSTRAIPTDWTHDGRYVVFDLVRPGTANLRDLWALPLPGNGKPLRLTETPFTKFAPRVSPDSRWVAYLSSESGQTELYIESFPQPGTRRQLSTNGAFMPRWSRDGRELFYVAPDTTLMAVAIKTGGPVLEAGAPTPLFKLPIVASTLSVRRDYDVAPDGHLLINVTNPAGSGVRTDAAPITVLLNWSAALKN
jgi:serine/threonine protein kinase